jgi:hypothetical protein
MPPFRLTACPHHRTRVRREESGRGAQIGMRLRPCPLLSPASAARRYRLGSAGSPARHCHQSLEPRHWLVIDIAVILLRHQRNARDWGSAAEEASCFPLQSNLAFPLPVTPWGVKVGKGSPLRPVGRPDPRFYVYPRIFGLLCEKGKAALNATKHSAAQPRARLTKFYNFSSDRP